PESCNGQLKSACWTGFHEIPPPAGLSVRYSARQSGLYGDNLHAGNAKASAIVPAGCLQNVPDAIAIHSASAQSGHRDECVAYYSHHISQNADRWAGYAYQKVHSAVLYCRLLPAF